MSMMPSLIAAQEQRLRRIAELSRYPRRLRTGPEQATIDRLARLIRLDARLWT